jgi:hypothetical protein
VSGWPIAACDEESCDADGRILTGSHELSGDQVGKLRCVQIATGDIQLSGVDSLAALEALAEVRGDLTISESPELPSLQGLERLTRVGGTLRIYRNAELTSLQGLEALEEVGKRLSIRDLPKLESLAGLDELRHVGGVLEIGANPELRSLEALGDTTSRALSVGGDLIVSDNAGLESIHFGDTYLGGPHVTGGIQIISNPSLREIANPGRPARASGACPALRDLWIGANDALESVTLPFSLSERICINITDNPRLQRITGEVGTFATELRLSGLPSLEVLELAGLAEFDSLAIVETGLRALDGLDARVRCTLQISRNPVLTQLGRLESSPGVVASTLDVHHNPLLSECMVAALIEALPTPAPFACADPYIGGVRLDRLVENRGNDASAVCEGEGGRDEPSPNI